MARDDCCHLGRRKHFRGRRLRRKSRLLTATIMIVLASLFLADWFVKGSLAAELPCILVEPTLTGAQPNEQFSLNVTVANAVWLWSYQVYVSFSPEVLEVVRVTEGNFLIRSTYNNTFWLPKWNNTLGLIQVWESLVAENPPPPEAFGSGGLFQITFKVKGFGNSVLHLHQTDTAYHDGSPIPHTTLDGIFTNLPNSVAQEIQWEDRTFYVNITSNSTVSPVAFDQPQKTVCFNVTGPGGTEGYALVSVPLMLLRAQTGEWQITVDATPSTTLVLSDSDCTFFYMEYGHSTHEIRIVGTEMIPEFSLAAILPFLVFFAMAFTIIAWKKALHAGK